MVFMFRFIVFSSIACVGSGSMLGRCSSTELASLVRMHAILMVSLVEVNRQCMLSVEWLQHDKPINMSAMPFIVSRLMILHPTLC